MLPAPPDPDAEGSSIEASYSLVITVNGEIAIKNNVPIRNHLEISQSCFVSHLFREIFSEEFPLVTLYHGWF